MLGKRRRTGERAQRVKYSLGQRARVQMLNIMQMPIIPCTRVAYWLILSAGSLLTCETLPQ